MNEGARISQAKYIMKLDAHCGMDEGFDVKLAEDCQPDWTMIPSMYNFHAFDWKCKACGRQTYQGFKPDSCRCGGTEHEMVMIWKPRGNKITYSWRFDKEMNFQYWRKHRKRPECQGDLIETMSCIGACFFMERKRFWDLGGMDELHTGWGKFGHMFRTGNFKGAFDTGSCFPYKMSSKQIRYAKEYSKDLWLNDKWPKAVRKLDWLVEHFKPVPDWHEGAK